MKNENDHHVSPSILSHSLYMHNMDIHPHCVPGIRSRVMPHSGDYHTLKNRITSYLIAVVLALLCMANSLLTAATVQTDRPDYPPGATAIITGTGWQPGETVTNQVLHADGTFDNTTSTAHAPDRE
jgi:hypothetical protein